MNNPEKPFHKETYEILRTKLAIPQARSRTVRRSSLLAQLDEGIQGKLTVISAPPGYGKTTLMGQWAAVQRKGNGTTSIGWVSLDAGDNDPIRFWRYLIAACQSFNGNTGASALELLDRPRRPSYEAALTSLINELAELTTQNILILEDYHVIQSEQIHESITYLLDHLPSNLHLIITTRRDPALPLHRLRVRNELTEIETRDLRFTPQEMREFLSQSLDASLSPEVLSRLEARIEGWPAGLRLVALALKGSQDLNEIELSIESLTGSHKHVLEYLVAEVLNVQPEPLQDFLLRTSVLPRLTGSLCDALTGRQDSTDLLEQIEKANLFLEPLDATHSWYRYHTLFSEAMQQEALARFGSETVRSLYETASVWLEEQDRLGDAVEAALSAGLFSRAADLIERLIQEAPDYSQEIYTLRRWLDAFPEQQLQESALLSFLYANAILYTSDRYAPETKALLETPLRAAERLWKWEANTAMVGKVIAFRSLVDWWQGDFAASFVRVKEALEFLPVHDAEWRGTCKLGLGVEALMAGEVVQARGYFLEARELLEASGNLYGIFAALQLLGLMYLRRGELNQANELFQEVLEQGHKDLSDRAQALAGLAETAYEWDDLEQARQLASEALDISRQVQEHDALVNSSITLARVFYAKDEQERAQQMMNGLSNQRHNSILSADIELGQAWIAYVRGDLAGAERWIPIWEQEANLPLLVQERRAQMAARLLISRGEADKAISRLEPWLEKARQQGRIRSEIEILTLQAAAWFSRSEDTLAKQSLLQALKLGQPEGYKRVFLDEGERMAVLLKETLPEIKGEALAGYARALLVVLAQNGPSARSITSGDSLPVEALSEQEKRVLRLLAAGRTYREIAEELVVSPNTIKTQIKSIYRKLGVSDRDEAREVARNLKMI